MAERFKNFYIECYLVFLSAKRSHIADIRRGSWRYVRVDEKGPYYLDGKGLYKKRFALNSFERWLQQLTTGETIAMQDLQELVFYSRDSRKKH
jgi:hypothetical protein